MHMRLVRTGDTGWFPHCVLVKHACVGISEDISERKHDRIKDGHRTTSKKEKRWVKESY